MIICGHRGGSKNFEPENTIRAFERAIDIGLKAIELDVSHLISPYLLFYRFGLPRTINLSSCMVEIMESYTLKFTKKMGLQTSFRSVTSLTILSQRFKNTIKKPITFYTARKTKKAAFAKFQTCSNL